MSRTMTQDAREHDRMTSTAPGASNFTRITFVSQVRLSHEGKVAMDWTDRCHGHDNFTDSHTCSATEEALMEGRLAPDNQVDVIRVSHATHNRALGASYEHRVVKRTVAISEIVVDGVGAEALR